MDKEFKQKTNIELSGEEIKSIAPPDTVLLDVLAGNMKVMEEHFKILEEKRELLRQEEEKGMKEIIETMIEQGSK
jgi:hypothetical protein